MKLTQKQRLFRLLKNPPIRGWVTSYEICKYTLSTAPATIISQLREDLRREGKFEIIDRQWKQNTQCKEYRIKRVRRNK